MKVIEKNEKGIFSYNIGEHTIVNNVPEGIPYNVFIEIVNYLVDGLDLPNFDNNRNVLTDLYSDFIFIEYSNEEVRKIDIENNKKIKIISPIKSETIDGSRQLAENVGEFEYNGKYYLVLCPYNTLTNETNPNKGVFRGVIVNSDKYFEVNNQANETNSKVKEVLN